MTSYRRPEVTLAALTARVRFVVVVVDDDDETRPDDADALAALADSLVEPRLVHRTARALAVAGDRDAPIAAATAAFAARQAAAQRPRTARPHRRGHSAPVGRPVRRRFTAQPSGRR
jgi:hypothetical protein